MLGTQTDLESNDNAKPERVFASSSFAHTLAFTLAEILIVIGILGMVAEMTIPTLMNNVDSKVQKVGLKKSFSTLSQAYLSLQTDNNGSITGMCSTNDSDCLTNLFKPYLRYSTSVSGTPSSTNLPGCWNNSEVLDASEPHTCLIMNDGTAIDFDMEYNDCNSRCAFINVDTNGLKKPNTWGKDRYAFILYDTKLYALTTSDYSCNNGTGVWTNNLGCTYPAIYQ